MKKNTKVYIVDYGQGNLGSMRNMLLRIGVDSNITKDPKEINTASHLILPGVGAFDRGMKAIEDLGLRDVLDRQALERRIPVLGVCLGAQLMTMGSEEGKLAGLGWFNANVLRFNFDKLTEQLPVPNIGWRNVRPVHCDTLTKGLGVESRFYFVHSYHLVSNEPQEVALMSTYGFDFIAGLQRDNLFSAQFHPEKSHSFGMKFLRNFINA